MCIWVCLWNVEICFQFDTIVRFPCVVRCCKWDRRVVRDIELARHFPISPGPLLLGSVVSSYTCTSLAGRLRVPTASMTLPKWDTFLLLWGSPVGASPPLALPRAGPWESPVRAASLVNCARLKSTGKVVALYDGNEHHDALNPLSAIEVIASLFWVNMHRIEQTHLSSWSHLPRSKLPCRFSRTYNIIWDITT